MSGIDWDKLADDVTRFWDTYGQAVFVGAAAMTMLLVAAAVWSFARSARRGKAPSPQPRQTEGRGLARRPRACLAARKLDV